MTEFLRLDMGPMSFISVFHPTLEAARGALYLGTIVNAIELSKGLNKRFWCVLNCTDDPELDNLNTESGFEVQRLNQWDGEEYTPEKIEKGLNFIDDSMRSGSAILVCCHAGISRSPGMVLAYLLKLGYVYKDALEIIRNARPFIQIHPKIDLSIRKYFGIAPRTEADLASSGY